MDGRWRTGCCTVYSAILIYGAGCARAQQKIGLGGELSVKFVRGSVVDGVAASYQKPLGLFLVLNLL